VQTPQQFYDWFALIDRSVAHSQEAHFRQHLLRVSEHLDMCDRLVSRIDQVDAEVSGMMDAWKSVEEGGKSLQDASQKLLDERVSSCGGRHALREVLMIFSGQVGGIAGGYWDDFGVFPRAGARNAFAQSPRGVARPANGLPLYGRTCGHLHRVPQIPRTVIFSTFDSGRSLLTHPVTSAITRKRKSTSCVSSNV
jgi:hypothetical protein